MPDINRRDFIAALTALGLIPKSGHAQAATARALSFEAAQPFSFDGLMAEARAMAERPYVPEVVRDDAVLDRIDYDQHWRIKYRPEATLEVDGGQAPIRMFHLGRYFKLPVDIHLVSGNQSQRLIYHRDLFEMPADSPARQLPDDIGFAGFRVLDVGSDADWLSFLGAAYFRTAGQQGQYGMSARAVALDVAMPTPEEFPRFTDFYLAPSESGQLVVHCLMNSRRLTGAFMMDVAKDGPIVMDITARFFARDAIDRVGLAPLTSMFWFSETDRGRRVDWRPEIHDSDGLAIWTGAGERLWRPLNNPSVVITSSFSDNGPKGFGLLQRDRDFANYEDDGVFYNKRASVWVEPKGDWGPGEVQLVEIPTDDEIHDNIAAYWVSDKPVGKGDAIALDYRLTWANDEPHPSELGHVVATRLGRGGIPGQPRPKGTTKIVVDFDGGPIALIDRENDDVEAVVTASRGTVSQLDSYSIKVGTGWRAMFDLQCWGAEPVDIRLYLKKGEETLTETWLYQFLPETHFEEG
ncbi:glucan biosynthesis protein [Consotaella aegiceratis]|uniref:glucan biosynthesis protein n=1 Tax=Consotaella aegiceratis TaxID=3097961 RepID=UPI002F41E33A